MENGDIAPPILNLEIPCEWTVIFTPHPTVPHVKRPPPLPQRTLDKKLSQQVTETKKNPPS